MKITYESLTGESLIIEASENWTDIIEMQNRKERNNNHKETRRHYHYAYGDESCWLASTENEPMEILIKRENQKEAREKLKIVFENLTNEQKRLIVSRYVKGKPVSEIAAEEGVSHQAISKRIGTIRKKLKEIF